MPLRFDLGPFEKLFIGKSVLTNNSDRTMFIVEGETPILRARDVLTPERAIEIQCLLGSDIQMQLDECIALPATPEESRGAVDRSLAWAELCKRERGQMPPLLQPGRAVARQSARARSRKRGTSDEPEDSGSLAPG